MTQPSPLDLPLVGARITALTRQRADILTKRGIVTVRDLLEHIPRRYIDLSQTVRIADLKPGVEATVMGTVTNVTLAKTKNRKEFVAVRVGDGSAFVEVIYWNQAFRARHYAKGMRVAIAGRFERKMGRLQPIQPFTLEKLDSDPSDEEGETVHSGRIVPVHAVPEGLTPALLRRFIYSALKSYGRDIEDPLPEELLERLSLYPRRRAFEQIHFPSNLGVRKQARRRLAWEELFVLSAGLAVRKRRIERETPGIAHPRGAPDADAFLASLPFPVTGAQRRAIEQIQTDMASAVPMHRLLQGEVGSGKTVVAVAAAVHAAANGYQTALMAPTEVLAEQHYLSVRRLLDPVSSMQNGLPGQVALGEQPEFPVVLLTGSVTGSDRDHALEMARSGKASMVVGTHALIQQDVAFANLSLAIVDEQHRFGVHQRIALRGRSERPEQPDLLIMTATPIPRTLAMTLYGDLDVSTLDEMPPGRTPVKTVVVSARSREKAEALIRKEVAKGRQAFVVCPLVEESDTLEVKAAEVEYERLRHEVFEDFRVGLIHGRMKPAEKEAVMSRMRAGDVDVLVATTVIEVGVDIPNATVMVIEDADRFGLSQLHQLRGRVGRGAHPGTCVLLHALEDEKTEERAVAKQRLKAMSETNDGFELAQLDLQIRGEGQIFGRAKIDTSAPNAPGGAAPMQAGATDLRFASLLRDGDLLAEARAEAFRLVDGDPRLQRHPLLLDEVRRRFAERLDWLFAG